MTGFAALGLMLAITAGDMATDTGTCLIVFTTNDCAPCKKWKRDELPTILRAGHSVDFIDISNVNRYDVDRVPTYWVWDRKTRSVKKTIVGVRSATILIRALRE